MMSGDPAPRPRHVVWGREVPFRNPNFTGRARVLAELRERLTRDATALLNQPPQPVYGLGGIGKTEVAAEYAHRFRGDYDLVWWIRAEREETIINALIALGKRMRLDDFHTDDRDVSIQRVLDALRGRDPFGAWLLIFDNAQTAAEVYPYIPRGGGHVIVTTRDQHWHRVLKVGGIEVSEFEPDETVAFLRKRVPGNGATTDDDALRLATELGNLPLAVEHAAAYLSETGMSVAEYIELFRASASSVVSEALDIPYPQAVATTWDLSCARLSLGAKALFKLLAFVSPEPISAELLVQPTVARGLPAPLDGVLSGTTAYRRAARELARFSLIKMDAARNVVQLHRVVQAVTKDQVLRENPEEAAEFRHGAHTLLAASDPGNPTRDDSEVAYERSRQHLVPSEATRSDNPDVRRLIINQVERLRIRGGYTECLKLGQGTLELWRELFGPDDRQTLALAVQVADTLRARGEADAATALTDDTLTRLRANYGEDDPVYLLCVRNHSISLRLRGDYAQALATVQDLLQHYQSVFGEEDQVVLQVRNSIAINLRCLGRYREALQYDSDNLREREQTVGPDATDTLRSRFGYSRDLRQLGRYEESLDAIREIGRILADKGDAWTVFRLLTHNDLAVALRRAGYREDAVRESVRALELHHSILGPRNRQSLQTATNAVNDHRAVENLAEAQALGEATVQGWTDVAGPDHPNTLAACANLAVVLRLRGNPKAAMELNERARTGFVAQFGEAHPSSLVASHNFASDLAMMGEVGRAREIGEATLAHSRKVRGDTHWFTLATMANLALDRTGDRDPQGARALREEALAGFGASESADHPDVRLAEQYTRVNLDIEPMSD
ncbi:FxSxx-COOH system tetratricopeptide repeat protein [Nonomuraea sp. NPDC050790]|uniref:FxSxx-COOH system tetratricopeptide repeat protein n=1 Tax=Nonomuraea sp. NPDC050790 TaxID=3364371 RepID=UPI0037B5AE08